MKIKIVLFTCALYGATIAALNAGLINGSFESPVTGPTGMSVYSSDPPLTGFSWTVSSGNIDLVRTYWQAASGLQSVDLDGSAAGAIYQDFTFDTAGSWSIKFAMSANPDQTGDKTLRVDFGTAGGPLTTLGTYTLSSNGRTYANMNWVTITTPTVTAQNAVVYRVQFTSLTPGDYGAAIDNVQLVPVPEPSSQTLLLLGALFTRVSVRCVRRELRPTGI